MNILIYGTGAVGTFLSSLIYEKNNNCILFSRGSKFDLFKNDGITLSTNLKQHETIFPNLFDTNKLIKLNDLPFVPDLIIYCVKSYHNDDSIKILKKIFQNTEAYILTLQNGFQSSVKLSDVFGARVITGAAYIDSVLDENGKVFETGGDPKIVMGSLYNTGKSLMHDFKDIFNSEKVYENNSKVFEYSFPKNKLQQEVTNILLKKGTSISKVLNTQAFSIRDLKRNFIIDSNISRNQLN